MRSARRRPRSPPARCRSPRRSRPADRDVHEGDARRCGRERVHDADRDGKGRRGPRDRAQLEGAARGRGVVSFKINSGGGKKTPPVDEGAKVLRMPPRQAPALTPDDVDALKASASEQLVELLQAQLPPPPAPP